MQPKINKAIDALASAAFIEGGVSAENTQTARDLTEQRKRELLEAIAEPCLLQIAEPAPQAALAAVPLPLLVRDIARDIGITVPEACSALKPLGNFSVNSVVTAEMARMLREHFPAPAHPAEGVPAPAGLEASSEVSMAMARMEQRLTYGLIKLTIDDDSFSAQAAREDMDTIRAALAATPAAPAKHPKMLVDAGALQMVVNALRRDAEEGKKARGEMADELLATATQAAGVPAAAPDARDVLDAARYRWLRSRDLETIGQGGVFAGMTPQNVILNENDLDEAVDAAIAAQAAAKGV